MKHSYLLSLGIVALSACSVTAQVLYQQDYNSLATSSTTVAAIAGYGAANDVGGSGWQIQGGCGGGTITLTTGINGNGVGGSQALFATWDNSAGSSYTWNQYTFYGIGAAGAGATLANISISLDIFMSGSDSTTPITVSALQNSGNSALDYVPTLTDGQYTHVAFSLGQATASGSGGPFDPTGAFWFRVSHGSGGFGFDNPNTVQIDNVMISAVPEPATASLLTIGAFGLLWLRRRS